MAKRKAGTAAKKASPKKRAATSGRTTTAGRRGKTTGRPAKTAAGKARTRKTATAAKTRAASARRPAAARTSGRKAARPQAAARKRTPARKPSAAGLAPRRRAHEAAVPSPPSSLNLNRRGSAARSGRAEIAESRARHSTMTPAIAGGDVDVDVESAYFTGDEAPGGDNPTPDQEVVDEIGLALGVQYQDNEELRGSDKVADRDKHRWELDPASSEDYRDRK